MRNLVVVALVSQVSHSQRPLWMKRGATFTVPLHRLIGLSSRGKKEADDATWAWLRLTRRGNNGALALRYVCAQLFAFVPHQNLDQADADLGSFVSRRFCSRPTDRDRGVRRRRTLISPVHSLRRQSRGPPPSHQFNCGRMTQKRQRGPIEEGREKHGPDVSERVCRWSTSSCTRAGSGTRLARRVNSTAH